MNAYITMMRRQRTEFSAFPMFYAFTASRFAEQMRERGLEPSDMDKICSLGDGGGFYLASDAEKYREMTERHSLERKVAIASDKTGDGFIYDMFLKALCDTEYGFTWEPEDALEALGYTENDLEATQG